jgi:three-Cys-motif partner protein
MTSRKTSAQTFGGHWSIHKVLTVERYLKSYRNVFKSWPHIRLIYIDAFAGSGSFAFKTGVDSPLFDETRSATEHAGSAMRALAVEPPFDHLFFIDRKAKNLKDLRERVAANADYTRRARILPGDANVHVKSLCAELRPWATKRGVIFLDPFGNQVEWATLKAIAATKALDVWYLFPLSGIFRNATLAIDALSADKRAAITRVLGTDEWMDRFYKEPERTGHLFDDLTLAKSPKVRSINVQGIEAFVHERLKTVFPHVLPPKTITSYKNVPAFSLFFAVSNPDEGAWGIASRIASHLLKKRQE